MSGNTISAGDDYRDGINDTSKPLALMGSEGVSGAGIVASSYIDPNDHDIFKVWLPVGYYTLTGMPVQGSALPAGRGIAAISGFGIPTTKLAIGNGSSDDANPYFEVTTSGYFYVDVWSTCYLCSGNIAFKIVATDLSNIGVTDESGGPSTTASLTVGAEKSSAVLALANDKDAYKVHLEAGKTYYFMMDSDKSHQANPGQGHAGYGVQDPLLKLFSPGWDGTESAALNTPNENNPNSGLDTQGSRDARIKYTATQTGDYYLQASSMTRLTTGDYFIYAMEKPVDDYADSSTSTSKPLIALKVNDTPTTAAINAPGDSDVFGVSLTAGVSYMLRANASATNGLGNPLLFLLDANEKPIYYNDDKGGDPLGSGSGAQQKDSLIIYTPTSTGTYYLAVQGIGNTKGQYQVSVAAVDDAAGSTVTAQRLVVNGNEAGGQIEIPGDSDWYGVYLSAGTTYEFEAQRAATNALSNPLLYLRDANGNVQAVNDDSSGLDSKIRFTATASGMYFLDVQDAAQGTGYYTISAKAADDHAAHSATSGVIDLESTAGASGRIDFGGDVDWLQVALDLNQTYAIRVLGADSGGGLNLADPRLLGVYDANGVRIYNSGNDDYGNSRDAFVRFTAPSQGRYYLAIAGSTLDDLGSYRVTVDALTTSDVAADTMTRATLAVGASVAGTLESAGDKDWYGVQLQQGQTYVIDLLGDVTSTNGLRDAVLGGIYASSGQLIANTTNNNYGASLNSRIIFTAEATGTYFIEAAGNTGHKGDYMLSLKNLSATGDAVGSDTAAHGQLTLTNGAGSATSSVDVARDVDWFAVTLQAGHAYELTVRGAASGLGTLLDPRLWGVYDAAGTLIIGTGADAGEGGVDARSNFTPAFSGTYYLAVGGTGDMTGSYKLEVSPASLTNDVAANAMTAATMLSGAAYDGVLETVGDSDWIRLDLQANKLVTLNLTGVKGSLGKVANPEIANIFNAQGEAIHLTPEKSTTSTEEKSFFSTQAGTYYVQVQSYSDSLGVYRLRVSETTDEHQAGESPELLGNFIDHDADVKTFSSTSVEVDGVITLKFGREDQYYVERTMIPVSMAKGSGVITISGAGQQLQIDVNSDQVQIYGDTVVINPDVNFLPNTEYAVFMDAGVLNDTSGVAFTGIGVPRESTYWGLAQAWQEIPGYFEYMSTTETVDDPNEFLFKTAAAPTQAAKDDWTVMVYMAADNDLEAQAVADLQELFAAQLPDSVNVVVMVDRAAGYDSSEGDWTGAYRGLVTPGMTVAGITASNQWTSLGEIDTGEASQLSSFITWAQSNHAADHYGLVVWGPGGGIHGMGWDYSAGLDNLTLMELSSAMSTAGLTETVSGINTASTDKFRLIDAQLAGGGAQVVLNYSREVYNLYDWSETVEVINPFREAFRYSLDGGTTWLKIADWSVSGNSVILDLGMTVDAGASLRLQYDSTSRPVYKHTYIPGFGVYYDATSGNPNDYTWATSSMEAASAAPRAAEYAAIRSDEITSSSYSGLETLRYNAASFDLTFTDKRLDLLAFDSSTMGLAETLWQVGGNAHTVVASEDVVPALGFDYDTWLQALDVNAKATGPQLAHELVDTYFAQNAGGISTSIASYDVDRMMSSQNGFVSGSKTYYYADINNFLYDLNVLAADALSRDNSEYWKTFQEAAQRVISAPTHDVVVDYYRDLTDFLQYLSERLTSSTLRDDAYAAYQTVLSFSSYAKTVDSGSAGLGIYLPVNMPVDASYVDNASGAAGVNSNFLFLTSAWYWSNSTGSNVYSYPQWDEFVQKLQLQVVNTAPTNVTVTPLVLTGAAGHVSEALGAAAGSTLAKDLRVATLGYTDSDGWTSSNTWQLTGADAGLFKVIGDGLYLKAGTSLDYEGGGNADHAFDVVVSVSDPVVGGTVAASATTSFKLTIDNADEALPKITSGAGVRVEEASVSNPLVYQTGASDDIGVVRYSLKAVGDAASFTIDATSGAVRFNGSLDYESRDLYTFTVVAEDAVGNRAEQQVNLKVGNVADDGTDTRGPIVTAFSPSDNSRSVALNSNIVVEFNEAVQAGAGKIVLKTLAGTTVETFAAGSTALTFTNDANGERGTLSINPTAQLDNNTMYIVAFEQNGIVDLAGNAMAGAIGDYNFKTIAGISGITTGVNDTVAPTLGSLALPAGQSLQSIDGDIVLGLSEAVQRGEGLVTLVRHVTDTVGAWVKDEIVETFDIASSSRVGIDNTHKTLTLDTTEPLSVTSRYTVQIDGTALRDAAGNNLATVSNANKLDFVTAADGGFDITLHFNESSAPEGGWTDAAKAVYVRAADYLESMIVGDLPDVRVGDQIIDDIVIEVNDTHTAGNLGTGGPTALRSDGGLPHAGVLNIDRVEIQAGNTGPDAQELLYSTVLHEMAHALGYGTLWGSLGLNKVNGQYTGENGLAAYREMTNNPALQYVPLETGVAPGVDNAHWKEDIFGIEIMTEWASQSHELMSKLTIASFADLGYQVEYSVAEPYHLSGSVVVPVVDAANDGSTARTLSYAILG